MQLFLRFALVIVPAVLLATVTTVQAGLNTYYQENFTGETGEGITDPGVYNANPNWSVDGSSAPASMGHAEVTGAPEVFEFYDLGGTGAEAGTGSVQLLTTAVAISIGNPAYFTYLTTTLNATLDRAAFDLTERLLVESLIDGNVVDSTTLTTAGNHLVEHDLLPHVSANTIHTYQLRITATQVQNGNPNFTVDDILVEGLSVPEPASMSLLGMGVAAICTAGYRRRQKPTAEISS